jgi:hypothetical protein
MGCTNGVGKLGGLAAGVYPGGADGRFAASGTTDARPNDAPERRVQHTISAGTQCSNNRQTPATVIGLRHKKGILGRTA